MPTRAIRALADTAASLPLHLYRRHADGTRERYIGRPSESLQRPRPLGSAKAI
jgi:phage portal protein BeeE